MQSDIETLSIRVVRFSKQKLSIRQNYKS